MPGPLDSDAPPAAKRPVRVVSWNLHNCRRGLEGIARPLRAADADVVGLQEVDRGTRRSGNTDQAAKLAEACGYPYFRFFRAIGRDRGEYGVALLSRWPLLAPRVGMLPNRRGFEQRIVATAVVEIPPTRFAVSVTHLTNSRSYPRLRREQAAFIAAQLRHSPLPQVVVGDFNEPPGGPTWRELASVFSDVFGAVGQGAGGPFPLVFPFLPALRIDYVFASPDLALAGARVIQTSASDHHLLLAEVWVPPPRAHRVEMVG